MLHSNKCLEKTNKEISSHSPRGVFGYVIYVSQIKICFVNTSIATLTQIQPNNSQNDSQADHQSSNPEANNPATPLAADPATVSKKRCCDVLVKSPPLALPTFTNLLTLSPFDSYLNEPTREVTPYCTCIDHVYFRHKAKSGNVAINSCHIKPNGLSDLYAIVINLSGLNQHSVKPAFSKNQQYLKFINWETLNTSLAAQNWKIMLSGKLVDDMFSVFTEKLNSLVTSNTRLIRKTAGRYKRNPWASDLLTRLSKQKNDLNLSVKKYPANHYLKIQYKKMSKRVQMQTIARVRKP